MLIVVDQMFSRNKLSGEKMREKKPGEIWNLKS